ncbi:MAG: hypothetical protein H6722_09115 [Sandaracinus sp.]|nr:hypothetical protein [Sandaracinus sp.]MCB9612595.1 hypothetical protein [Sandaracinus sp.]
MTLRALPFGLAFLVSLVACGDDDSSPPRGCRSDDECPASAPRCLVDETGAGECSNACGTDRDCESGQCIDGTCAECLAPLPGSIDPGEACGCNADCAGTDAVCEVGLCVADCRTTGCPEGQVCEGNPGRCILGCEGEADRAEGATCDCNAQCLAGLSCLGGFCGESCEIDETCGAGECGHEVLVPASCRPISESCGFEGTTALGEDCVCNAACDFAAPVCVGFFAEGFRGQVCSRACGPEEPCEAGSACCAVDAQAYCLPPDLAASIGATCEP